MRSTEHEGTFHCAICEANGINTQCLVSIETDLKACYFGWKCFRGTTNPAHFQLSFLAIVSKSPSLSCPWNVMPHVVVIWRYWKGCLAVKRVGRWVVRGGNAHVCDIKYENQDRASGICKVCNICLKVGKLHRKIVSIGGGGWNRCVARAKSNSDVDGRRAYVGNGLPSRDCGSTVTKRGWECIMRAFR
jgi:hypothetical protein